MVFVGAMKKPANDNEPNPWSTIGWQAALIVNRLRCQAQILELMNSDEKKDKGSSSEPDPSNANKQRPEDDRRYIEQRLREIRAWEKRQKGIKF